MKRPLSLPVKSSNSEHLHCDAQAVAGLRVINYMGAMGIAAVIGLLVLAYAKREPNAVVLTALSSAIGGALTGMPSLLGRLTNQAQAPAPPAPPAPPLLPVEPVPVTVENTQLNPVPTEDAGADK
jgi:hypothetical protein